MTLTFELDLEIRSLDLHAKIQIRMSVCSAGRVETHIHTDRKTHNVKTITPVADAGCHNVTQYSYQRGEHIFVHLVMSEVRV